MRHRSLSSPVPQRQANRRQMTPRNRTHRASPVRCGENEVRTTDRVVATEDVLFHVHRLPGGRVHHRFLQRRTGTAKGRSPPPRETDASLRAAGPGNNVRGTARLLAAVRRIHAAIRCETCGCWVCSRLVRLGGLLPLAGPAVRFVGGGSGVCGSGNVGQGGVSA